jgi:hypothetical protein
MTPVALNNGYKTSEEGNATSPFVVSDSGLDQSRSGGGMSSIRHGNSTFVAAKFSSESISIG